MKFWVIHAQENPELEHSQGGGREWRSNGLARLLAERGHDVVRWRSSFSHRDKNFLVDGSVAKSTQNYVTQFLYGPAYARHVGLRRIKHHQALGHSFASVAQHYIDRGERPDLIHVCNVPTELCVSAVKFAKKNDIPVLVDIRDLWPDIYADLIPESVGFLRDPAARLLNRASLPLRRALKEATGITALTESYLNWGLATGDRRPGTCDGIFPMMYPVQKAEPAVDILDQLRETLNLAPGDVVASYAGNIGYQSDFDLVIEAANLVRRKHPNLKVVIAGSGPRSSELKAKFASNRNVLFPGWLDGDQLSALLHLSDIGLIAYKPIKNFLLNVPNKFSEYLASGMAVACSIEGEMGSLVRENKCGFVYSDHPLEQLTEGLSELARDVELRKKMQKASRDLHRLRFDRNTVMPKFADHLEYVAMARESDE